MKPFRHLLIDGDILMFKFAFRHQTDFNWPNGASTQVLNEKEAKTDLDAFIVDLAGRTECPTLTICFTSPLNFRYAVLPTYKQNRVNSKPPVMLRILKNHMRDSYDWMCWEGCEADDVMGILGTNQPTKYVVASTDKDFRSLPITLFNWDKDRWPKRISQKEADYNFHLQWLKGDSTDGFYGAKQVGDKTARKLLDKTPPEEWSLCVVSTYATNRYVDYTWDDIVAQARMARILRHTDWNFQRKEPILWTPDV